MKDRNYSCLTCYHYKPTGYFDHGECRRHAPKCGEEKETYSYNGHKAEWPIVSEAHGWCGDYTPIPHSMREDGD